jgi:transposase
VRSREDCRGDLMRARHRLSTLLLRHGTVYDDGAAWTTRHDGGSGSNTWPARRRRRSTPTMRRCCRSRLAVIGDWDRFTGNSIDWFVGLVPSEFSSGQSRVQGPITKTGNGHARRLLAEAAWHHRPRYHVGAVMRQRWEQASVTARARGDLGNRRLHDRWVGFMGVANDPRSRTSPSPGNWLAGAGRWP